MVCEDVLTLVSVNVSHHGVCEDIFHLVSIDFLPGV